MKRLLVLVLILLLTGCKRNKEEEKPEEVKSKSISGVPAGSEIIGLHGCLPFGGLKGIANYFPRYPSADKQEDGSWITWIVITCKDETHITTKVPVE